MEIVKGATRTVILTKRYAFKIPRMINWRSFFWGMLSNNLEQQFWKTKDQRLCPITFSLPMGLLNVMPRCEEMTDEEMESVDIMSWVNGQDDEIVVPVEPKTSSFGKLDGRMVAIDYGGPYLWYTDPMDENVFTIYMQGYSQKVKR